MVAVILTVLQIQMLKRQQLDKIEINELILNSSTIQFSTKFNCVAVSLIPAWSSVFALGGASGIDRGQEHDFGPRAFPVFGPTVWNSLPRTLRSPELCSYITLFRIGPIN